jgi:uncharacterized protein DUF2795
MTKEDQAMARSTAGQSPANIAKYLGGIDFSADKDDIVEHAEEQNADDEVLSVLQRIPDKQYGNMADLMKGVGAVE